MAASDQRLSTKNETCSTLEVKEPEVLDERYMARAVALAERVRGTTAPNPWVGAVVTPAGARSATPAVPAGSTTPAPATPGTYEGATSPPGGPHAEVNALRLADLDHKAKGSTLYSTLEPCTHFGQTPPCVDAVIGAGVARVVIGVLDPDPRVSGRGAEALRAAGIEVAVGVGEREVREQLAPYFKHRQTGRPWVVLKLAASLDGRTAAPDRTSQWITGEAARRDAHRLREISDAVLVGAGTVRADDPRLTARLGDEESDRQPLRVVLGRAPQDAKVRPALELSGELGEVLDELGSQGVVQLLVEGGATVAREFHEAGLVDRYVVYLAAAFFGGDDARPMFAGPGASSIDAIWRGRLVSVEQLGEDLRVEVAAA